VGGEGDRGRTWRWAAVVELETLKPRKKNIFVKVLVEEKETTYQECQWGRLSW
jgi:hypothetical protein